MLGGKFKKAVAITGLVFMVVFVAVLPVYLANPKIWSGRVGLIALFTGIIGLICFFIIWMDKRALKREERLRAAKREAEEAADKTANAEFDAAGKTYGKNDLPPKDKL